MAPKKNRKPNSVTKQVHKRKSQGSKIWLAIIVIVLVIAGVAIYASIGNQAPPPAPIEPTKVLFETTAGNITIDLRTDKPVTSTNFINLCNDGRYDNSTFHRAMASFMIQGGQVSGTVNKIKDEIGSNNLNSKYTIAMAKTMDPDSATSEFFINTVDNSGIKRYDGFDDTYTVFGTVIEGQSVVDAIANAPVTANPAMGGEESLPVNPVVILHTYVIPY